jgi:probable metal-binding protein
MIHGHEVLDMMQGHSYSEKSLLEAIIEKFGADARFYTCSAENLTAQGLIDFLKEHGKFKPMGDGFTVDTTKVCEND